MSSLESLELAGVPVLVRQPANPRLSAPLIVLWHGAGIPGSEEMLAELLPLEEVQAWKAYLGLPLFGKRDDRAGIGLFGFSVGGIAALLTLLESPLPITTAVLAGVTKDLVSAVNNYERIVQGAYSTLKKKYPWVEKRYRWSAESEVAKQRLDFLSRASNLQKHQPMPAVLFVHGSQDEIFPVSEVEELYATLAPYYEQAAQSQRLSLRTFEHLKHNIDLEAAKNYPDMQQDIAELQRIVSSWFSQHLIS
jgi:pimeloyl-ACP methyl ester carboxylesterase